MKHALSFLLALTIPLSAFGKDFEFGTVAITGDGWVKASPNRDTTPVIPKTVVIFQTTIEGVPEPLESGKGYAFARRDDGMLDITVTEGEPQIGDTALLAKEFFELKTPPVSYEAWYKMGARDQQVGHDEGFMGASCALAERYASGAGVKKDRDKAFMLYNTASKDEAFDYQCAYLFSTFVQYGYEQNGKLTREPKLALKWSKFAAKSGKAIHVSFYAEVLESQKKFAEAEMQLQSIIKTGKPNDVRRAKKQLASLNRAKNYRE